MDHTVDRGNLSKIFSPFQFSISLPPFHLTLIIFSLSRSFADDFLKVKTDRTFRNGIFCVTFFFLVIYNVSARITIKKKYIKNSENFLNISNKDQSTIYMCLFNMKNITFYFFVYIYYLI